MKTLRRNTGKPDAPAAGGCTAPFTRENPEAIHPMLRTVVIGGTASAVLAMVVAGGALLLPFGF
jgi:hypothetical protein